MPRTRIPLVWAVLLAALAAPALAQPSQAPGQAPAEAAADPAPPPARAEKRIALVVGNGDYRSVERLGNPVNDARLVADTLRAIGFELIGGGPQVNLDKAELDQAIQGFGRALAGTDVALFYYSGHGLQVAGINWLVPVDANPTRAQDLEFQMVDAEKVLRQMDGAGTKLNILILDACRNNPFPVRGLRAAGGGLAEMRAPEGTLISYATQPGNVARDGAGANSPYTEALARTMRQPGLDLFRTFNQVGLTVKRATGGEQQPWVSNSPIDGEFHFAGIGAGVGAGAAAGLGAGIAPPAPAPQTVPAIVSPAPPQRTVTSPPPTLPGQPSPNGDRSRADGASGAPRTGSGTTSAAARTPPPPAPRRVAPAAQPGLAAPGCGDLMMRYQLGEPLSATERATLQSGCRR